ncbi:MAG: hypothetical protein KC636_29040, partial [Myxococcales bacterium]|nr:hypothetical protein [Myxococcales bacterium]
MHGQPLALVVLVPTALAAGVGVAYWRLRERALLPAVLALALLSFVALVRVGATPLSFWVSMVFWATFSAWAVRCGPVVPEHKLIHGRMADDPVKLGASPGRLVAPLLKLFGSAAAVATALVFFGFLSQSAHFGFAGLPVLSLDYTALIEVGATAIFDSVSEMLGGSARSLVLLLALALALGCWLASGLPWMRRVTRNPLAMFAAHVMVLVLVVVFLYGGVRVTQMGTAEEQRPLVATAVEARAQAADVGAWPPSALHAAEWRATASLVGFWGQITDVLIAREAPTDAEVESFEPHGQKIRQGDAAAALRARDLYGWMFLFTVMFMFEVVLLYMWRRWLQRAVISAHLDDRPVDEQSSPVDPLRVLRVTALLVEPLTVVSVLLCAAIIPVAHGVLAHDRIGHDEVLVQLRPTEECIPGPAFSGWDVPQLEEVAVLDVAAPPSEDVLKDTKDPPARKLAPLRACALPDLSAFDEVADRFGQALYEVLAEQPDSETYGPKLAAWREAVDGLFELARRRHCIRIYQHLWDLRPHPAVFERHPLVASYFWARWNEFQALTSHLRFGHILHYPRGTTHDSLSLFSTVIERTPRHRGQWVLQEIPRACIQDVTVLAELSAAVRAPVVARRLLTTRQTSPLRHYYRQPSPAALRELLAHYRERNLSLEQRIKIVEFMGVMARLFERHDPRLSERTVDLLISVMGDAALAVELRAAAARGLEYAGGAYAADALASAPVTALPEEIEVARIRALGVMIREALAFADELTAIGATRSCEDGQASAPAQCRAQAVADALVDELVQIAGDPSDRVSAREAACAALGGSRHPQAPPQLEALARAVKGEGQAKVLDACVVARGVLSSPSAREFLVEHLQGFRALPESTAAHAFALLARGGLSGHEALFVDVLSHGSPHLQGLAAAELPRMRASAVDPALLRCAQEERDPAVAELCLRAMMLVGDGNRGAPEVVAALSDMSNKTREEGPKAAVCEVLHCYGARGNTEAAEIAAGACGEYSCPGRPNDLFDRLRKLPVLPTGASEGGDAPRGASAAHGENDLSVALEERNVKAVESAVFGSVFAPGSRELLRSIAAGAHPWLPGSVRHSALGALNILGYDERDAALVVELYRQRRGAVSLGAALGLNDLPVVAAARELVACVRYRPEEREWCRQGLTLLTIDDGEARCQAVAELTRALADPSTQAPVDGARRPTPAAEDEAVDRAELE